MNPLIQFREQIDTIDTEIIHLLSRRFEIVRGVGQYKKQNNLPPLQPGRWQEVLESKKQLAREHGMSEEFVVDVWNRIHEYALEIEKGII
ncbi:MAG: chorismate mutase [Candidatus Gracilibacteria bacterium]|nr:chorismate mutase [Candidatus Gracilibacteria bacterium]